MDPFLVHVGQGKRQGAGSLWNSREATPSRGKSGL